MNVPAVAAEILFAAIKLAQHYHGDEAAAFAARAQATVEKHCSSKTIWSVFEPMFTGMGLLPMQTQFDVPFEPVEGHHVVAPWPEIEDRRELAKWLSARNQKIMVRLKMRKTFGHWDSDIDQMAFHSDNTTDLIYFKLRWVG